MKHKAILALGQQEREQKLKDAQFELMKLRAQVATGTSPKKSKQIGELKKIVARIKTIQNQK